MANSSAQPSASQPPRSTPETVENATGQPGFFSTLLSPIYRSPARGLGVFGSGGGGGVGTDGPPPAVATSTESRFFFGFGRSPTTATTSTAFHSGGGSREVGSTVSAGPGSQQHLQAPVYTHRGSEEHFSPVVPSRSSSINSRHGDGASSRFGEAANSVAPFHGGENIASPSPLTDTQSTAPKPGYRMQLFRFASTEPSAVPVSSPLTTHPPATSSTSGVVVCASRPPLEGGATQGKGSAPRRDELTRPRMDPPPEEAHARSVSPSQKGLCAPHMLGYRQCLEMNPDSKANCTWALDSFLRCQEDAQM